MRENIIIPAWELVSSAESVKKFNFFPSLIATVELGCLILYQFAWGYIYLFGPQAILSLIVQFVHSDYLWQSVIGGIAGFVLYMFLVPFAEGGVISLIDKYAKEGTKGQHYTSFGISKGLLHFLPVLEISNLVAPFKIVSIITFYLLFLRLFGRDYIWPLSYFAIGYTLLTFVLNILFAYARFFVIFEGKTGTAALSASVGMALNNLKNTFNLYFSILLVYLQSVFVLILFVFLPIGASAILAYISLSLFRTILIAVFAIVFVVLLFFVSHLNSVLTIFTESLWYYAYKTNKGLSAAKQNHIETEHHDSHDDHHSNHH